MVIIRQQKSNLLIASGDQIIHSNVDTEHDQCIKIPAPILPIKGQSNLQTITTIQTSKNQEYLAIATENKQIIIYTHQFQLVRNFTTSRAPSKLHFTKTNDLLVADKTGDVYLYSSKNDNDLPILLLGHLSIILDLILSDCGNFIITCDRDEKIRVSQFPNAYNVVSFCLGHTEFVVALSLVDKILISASGDGTVRFWDFVAGRELNRICTNDYINDGELLEEFASEMDAEKVDVTALPIVDMQTQYLGDKLIIAVGIHKCSSLHLYTSDLRKGCLVKLLQRVEVHRDWFRFSLDSSLIVLTSDELKCYNLSGESNYEMKQSCYFDKLHDNYKNLFAKNVSCISVLYKRKFDNVQEYLERKRARLEAK